MHTVKRWHAFLILAVIVLTIYNILPTVFFYSKPLKKPVSEKQALNVGSTALSRVNSLEPESLAWAHSQAKNLKVKLKKASIDSDNPQFVHLQFDSPRAASFFAKVLPQAGALIPFAPAQLSLAAHEKGSDTVTLRRHIGVHFDPTSASDLFTYVPKETKEGKISPMYRSLTIDRTAQMVSYFLTASEASKTLAASEESTATVQVARKLVEFDRIFPHSSEMKTRFFATYFVGSDLSLAQIEQRFRSTASDLSTQLADLEGKQGKKDLVLILKDQVKVLNQAKDLVNSSASLFKTSLDPVSVEQIQESLIKHSSFSLEKIHPFIASIAINWEHETVDLRLFDDVKSLCAQAHTTESESLKVDLVNQFLYHQITKLARQTDESFLPKEGNFVAHLNALTGSSSLLLFDLRKLAEQEEASVISYFKSQWSPKSAELSSDTFSIGSFQSLSALPKEKQRIGLFFYTPLLGNENIEGTNASSIYVIAKGFETLSQRANQSSELKEDLNQLDKIFKSLGFIHYKASLANFPKSFKGDHIFELDDFASYFLAATREDFEIKGSKQYASLEFTNYEQRLLTENKIDTRIHETLLKWRDEYQAAKVNLSRQAHYTVPKPTKSAFWSNLTLSTKKYFRGDDRKILKWGLDLSGGKTVRVGLKNAAGEEISNPDDLKQALNELYARVNKLGLSEVNMRIEGSSLVLDFPGSQGLSASELIEASTMSFHVMNEKFSLANPTLSEAVNTFLEEVYSEAVITNRLDLESLNQIAWQHLGGNPENPDEFSPLTSHAKLLYDQGLRFASKDSPAPSYQFDETLSSIGIYRGNQVSAWHGQSHPLVILFRNFALEGKNLSDVQTGYDSSKGNILNFSVKSSASTEEGYRYSPRDIFYDWTSAFAEERIGGTAKEAYSSGRGWRMAVVLNGTIIQAPSLSAALRDHASISGAFSQREITQLAADLKAGSLSFTPKILSEENISPELGKEQRFQGLMASFIGLLFVIGLMCSYYRFGGVIASIAVLFNLLIMWGVLQNLHAALTLPGIAGIILTMGMAVDANVLVFERIREEFALTKRITAAITAGYKKAFTAIVDSNLTTIIAALILLNFDSGPIKGFAYTLIIGIVSSMFTALFMTRYFFSRWVRNPKNTELKMASFLTNVKTNFLKHTKIAAILSSVILLAGAIGFYAQKGSFFGMDFTGGYALTVDLKTLEGHNYQDRALEALYKAGAKPGDVLVKTLSKENHLKIQLGTSIEKPGHPFYELQNVASTSPYLYQNNPKIVWIVHALDQANLHLNETSLSSLHLNWSEVSGQFSDTMRFQAFLGLGLALLAILIYISFRFEFKYALSATLALMHDLLLALGFLALIHLVYPQVQFDMQIIAALMTIIGYSLNDTIIIFDRIRESLKTPGKMTFKQIVNDSLNATLSRTIMTSATTLIVLIALVLFGGSSIFGFSLIMSFGVIVGTFSSLFIASPLLVYFHEKEIKKETSSSVKKINS